MAASTAVLGPPDSSSAGPVVAEASEVGGWVATADRAITGLRRCLQDPGGRVGAGEVLQIERLVRRLDAARLMALGRIDADRAMDDAGPVTDSASASTGSWYAKATRTDGAAAAGDAQLARRLTSEDLASTREAMDDGALSTEHAKVIAHAMTTLPAGLTPQERARIERHLVEQARLLDPKRLRRAARRALAALGRPDEEVDAHHGHSLRDEEERARARTRLTMHDNGDGTTSGHFTIPTLAASMLRKIVQQMTAPRRHQASTGTGTTDGTATGHTFTKAAQDAETGDDAGLAPTCRPPSDYTDRDGGVDSRAMATDWAHAQGLAFTSLLEHLPTEHLHSKTAATVVISLDLDQLISGLAGAGVDTGIEISAADARRLACTAGIVPAVLAGGSLPLDLGQQRRLFTENQRLALATLYDTCAIDGCDRPFAWSEIHHLTPFAAGGPTDLSNAVPACAFHHHKLDDPTYDHTVLTDAHGKHTITIRRRT